MCINTSQWIIMIPLSEHKVNHIQLSKVDKQCQNKHNSIQSPTITCLHAPFLHTTTSTALFSDRRVRSASEDQLGPPASPPAAPAAAAPGTAAAAPHPPSCAPGSRDTTSVRLQLHVHRRDGDRGAKTSAGSWPAAAWREPCAEGCRQVGDSGAVGC